MSEELTKEQLAWIIPLSVIVGLPVLVLAGPVIIVLSLLLVVGIIALVVFIACSLVLFIVTLPITISIFIIGPCVRLVVAIGNLIYLLYYDHPDVVNSVLGILKYTLITWDRVAL